MIVLDTTVLVYAKGADHRFREPCRDLIVAIAARRIAATTTVEVLQEFTHVRAQRRGRSDAAGLARDYAELLSPLLAITDADLRLGLSVFERHERLGAFDAVLGAAAVGCQAGALVSADASFDQMPEIEHVVPDAAGVARLIAGRI